MTAADSVKITVNQTQGHIMLSLSGSGESSQFTREETLDLASRLVEAANSLEVSNEGALSEADDDLVRDLLEDLKHEEKVAHGGD